MRVISASGQKRSENDRGRYFGRDFYPAVLTVHKKKENLLN